MKMPFPLEALLDYRSPVVVTLFIVLVVISAAGICWAIFPGAIVLGRKDLPSDDDDRPR